MTEREILIRQVLLDIEDAKGFHDSTHKLMGILPIDKLEWERIKYTIIINRR